MIDASRVPERLEGFAATAGSILAVSYPVLAISTGARAGYQLWLAVAAGDPGVTHFGEFAFAHRASLMSALAAACYLTATVGFAVKRRWAWYVSAGVLAFETVMTLIIGTLSVVRPELIGRTVWRLYGIDYGFFPLIQPLLGLLWLLMPATTQAYGVRRWWASGGRGSS